MLIQATPAMRRAGTENHAVVTTVAVPVSTKAVINKTQARTANILTPPSYKIPIG